MRADSLTSAIAADCRKGGGPVAIERAVAGRLQHSVGFDAWCALTIDPASVLPTGGYHEEGVPLETLPHLVQIEARGEDVLALPALARVRSRVATLSQATGGKPDVSQRYREVLKPSGLGHELRAMFTTRSGPWGVLVLFRGASTKDFSAEEADLIARSTSCVGSALRREMVLTEIERSPDPEGPGLVLLDASLNKMAATSTATGWLSEIDDGLDRERQLPYAVTTLGHRATAQAPAPVRTRIRTRSGRWLTLHAEQLAGEPSTISVIIEPARPTEIAELVADAYQLTARERTIVRLLCQGTLEGR